MRKQKKRYAVRCVVKVPLDEGDGWGRWEGEEEVGGGRVDW